MLIRQIVSGRNTVRNLAVLAIRPLSSVPPSKIPQSQQPIPFIRIHNPTKTLPPKIHIQSADRPSKTILQRITENPIIKNLVHVLELAVDMGLFLGISAFIVAVIINYPILLMGVLLFFVIL